ncbi:hypothetical protein KCU91_g7407, partial [Aureobasidium melanogenum]
MTHIPKQSHRRANPPIEDAAEAFDRLPKSSGFNCDHPADTIKKGQACAYHEHESPDEWKTCAGDDFQQSVDLAYLRGTTATDPVPWLRFARFDDPDSMVYRLGGRP